MRALNPKACLNFLLSTLASPAATTKIALSSFPLKDNVFAIRSGMIPIVSAACCTVALGVSNSMMSCSRFHCLKCSFTLSNDMLYHALYVFLEYYHYLMLDINKLI